MRTTTRLAAFILVASAALGPPAVAQTPAAAPVESQDSPTAQARQHFLRGVDLFKERNFRAALVEFQRAQDIAPNWRLYYNIAQTQFELHNYAGTLRSFQQYLAEGGQDIEETRRAEVQREIEKLRGRVAKVRLTVNEVGAEVRIDDEPAGTTPLPDPIVISAGHVKIEVRKGASTAVRYVDVAGGDDVAVDLVLAKEQAGGAPMNGPVATQPRPAAPVQAGRSNTGVWVGVAVTGALAAGAVVTGIVALGAKSDYDSELGAFPGSANDVDSARSKTKTFALATDILGGAAIASGIVTIVLASSGSSPSEPAATTSKVQVSLGPSSVALQGSF